jgi:hypothetical protein
MERRFFPYVLVALTAATLLFLLVLDRRHPIFSTPAGMMPFLFIVLAIAATLALHVARSPNPVITSDTQVWLSWHRAGLIGGALTGLLFLGVYWAYDWPAPNRSEISERRVNEIWITPDPLTLIPGYMLVGAALGLVVGFVFPRWHALLRHHTQQRQALRWLNHPYPSGLLFGISFGAFIGAWLCPMIFSISDGRPFIRVSTSAISVFLAVGFYLLFELARFRHRMDAAAYQVLATVLGVGILLACAVWFLDAQLEISATAYCLFYDTWNTHSNELKPGWLPALAGAAYGGLCGAIIMSVASGYMLIRAALAAANHPAART